MIRLLVVTFVLFFSTSSAHAPDNKVKCPAAEYTCNATGCTLSVEFLAAKVCTVRIDDAFVSEAKAERITESTVFRVRVPDVNSLRYALKVETKETVIDTYVYLEKLWKQIIGLPRMAQPFLPAGADPTPEAAFVDAINKWRELIGTTNTVLSGFVAKFKSLTLNTQELKAIATEALNTPTKLAALETARAKAAGAIWRSENYPVYDTTLASHQAVVDKLESFVDIADLIAAGYVKKIEFGDAGRVVTVTITATERASTKPRDETIVVEFLVHSTLPVTFHAGYAVRALRELRFQPIAAAASTADGADLFSKVQDKEATGDFTAFMSYRLCSAARARKWNCPQATIGTDFKDVGKRLYGGLSWPMGRSAFLTVGVVNGETQEGEGPVSDVLGAAGEAAGSGELFKAITQARKWGGFAGISFAPF